MEAMRLSVLLRMVEHDSGLASSSQPDQPISFTTLATAAPLLSSSPCLLGSTSACLDPAFICSILDYHATYHLP